MIQIKYTDSPDFIVVTFHRLSEHVVTISADGIDPNISGFSAYRMNGDYLGDFTKYTTVYRAGGNYVTYSDDGSVHIAVESPNDLPPCDMSTVWDEMAEAYREGVQSA